MYTRPAVSRSIPATQRRRVVFPEPDGPRRTQKDPGSTRRSTASSAVLPPNCLVAAQTSRADSTDPFDPAAPADPFDSDNSNIDEPSDPLPAPGGQPPEQGQPDQDHPEHLGHGHHRHGGGLAVVGRGAD